MYLDLPDPDPLLRGTNLDPAPDPSKFYHQAKNSKKNRDSYYFVTSFLLYIFEKLCKCSFKKVKRKQIEEKKLLVAILKVTDENSRIRSRIWIRLSEVRIRIKMSRIRNTAKKQKNLVT
jgi:hypothetical protein